MEQGPDELAGRQDHQQEEIDDMSDKPMDETQEQKKGGTEANGSVTHTDDEGG